VKTVADFLKDLDLLTASPKPVNDILITSHANDRGWLEIGLDGKAVHVKFKVLMDAVNDPARRMRLRIDPSLYKNADGSMPARATRILMRGCRIGEAPKFVDALKVTLGGAVQIVAPRFFHVLQPWDHITVIRKKKIANYMGVYEFLGTNFKVSSPTALKAAKVIEEMKKIGKKLDGTDVDDHWTDWVPTSLPKKQGLTVNVPLGRTIDDVKVLPAKGEFRADVTTYPFTINNAQAADKTLAGLKAQLAAQPDFQPGWGSPNFTAYPMYEQYGYADVDEFFAGFTWTPPKKRGSDPFIWTGTRFDYTVILPVTNPATGNLIYNFFPPRGSTTLSTVFELDDTTSPLFPKLFYVTP